MMTNFFDIIYDFFYYGLFLYSFSLIIFYLILAGISVIESIHYMRRNSFVDYKSIANSPLAPSISIIAPAYNEGKTIIENVRSLIAVRYNNSEVLIINDGSTDNSLEKLIYSYDLEKVSFKFNEQIKTLPVKAVYKSRMPAYSKITVVDKQNGGKSDALNCGLNIAQSQYVACVDADCILEQDCLLKMIKPFLEDEHGRVIATGGVVRIANDCVIENGRLVKVNVPKKLLPRVQTLEYIRTFLLGRMAWGKLNGLLLISGAFGLFDKKIVIECGGYNTKTVGEDMELVVRMRRYMHDMKQKYKAVYIPDPLCWTEAPATLKILRRQRNRWTRGTAETLWIHRKIFFNPKYKSLGMISYPYWLFYEWLAPIIELAGVIYFAFFAALGEVNWLSFLTIFGLVYSFVIMFSLLAILSEELSYHQYTKKSDLLKLVGTAMLEPFTFHPYTVWSAITGNFDLFIKGKKNWGDMTRQGFGKNQKHET